MPHIHKRLSKLEAHMKATEPIRITIEHYLGEDTEPLRRLHNLPLAIRDWPAEFRAMVTPLSVRTVVL